MNKKRIATSVAAVATAAALLLGGTFAWQSVNQTALNEASDVINPGGRLHDDFNGENKDIYVENFAEEPIYARIQLGEYFEIITNFGAANEDIVKSTQILGSKNDDGTYNYETFYFDGKVDENGVVNAGGSDEEGNHYWTWQTGGSTVYMPTFNMNKDSLAADINGIYENGNVGTISDRVLDLDVDDAQYSDYTDYVELGEGYEEAGTEIYDADANNVEDDGIKEIINVEHTAKSTENATLMSMQQWIDEGSFEGPYWVYDTDGWVYWAQAIEPETATGLLLDGIELNQVMDDSWYYAINVVAQFVTADDVGKTDGTGFYVTGTEPTEEAEDLLRTIGVTLDGSEDDDFVAQAGIVNSDGGISLDINSPYINVNGNTITINTPAASADDETWYTAPTNLSDTTLTWGALSSRIAYKLNEGTGEYEEWGSYVTADNEYGYVDSGYSEPFDMCMGEGLDIFLGSADAGTYKIVGSGTDENGEEWSGEVVLTVDYVADEGGDEDEEPEDPYGFHHMLLSMNNEKSFTETFFDEGYLTPGDTIQFGVAAYYNNGETIEINSSNASWEIDAIEGELADGTTISEDGKLTVAENQGDLSVINVQVIFTDKDGVEHIKEMSILVSNESITLSLTIDAGGPYYIDEEYSFTAIATSISGEVVPMMWMYDISPVDMGSDLSAYSYTEPKFMAEDAGDYYLRAWAEYMPGQKAEIPVTVEEGGTSDTTAPTVSSVTKNGTAEYSFTIANVSDTDFPMTMDVYWAWQSEEVYTDDAHKEYTVTYTLEDGEIFQTGSGTTSSFSEVTYSGGTVTSTLNVGTESDGYWGVTVTDASGNIGKLEDPFFVEPAIGCFVAGTQVQTVKGLVNIEDIKVGDMVYSIDLTTGAKVVSPVTWVQGTRYTEATYTIYADGEKVVTTYEHPFYVMGKKWVAAEDLAVGDKIKTVDGQVTITKIVYTELDAPVQVYNFTVDGTHNYLISEIGLLVHNVAK